MKNWIKEGNTVVIDQIQAVGEERRYKLVPGVIEKVEQCSQDGTLIYLRGHKYPVAEMDVYPCLQWVPIDPENLPEHNVLAACFDKNSAFYGHKMIGLLMENNAYYKVTCDNESEHIGTCTHYIDINNYDIEP